MQISEKHYSFHAQQANNYHKNKPRNQQYNIDVKCKFWYDNAATQKGQRKYAIPQQ